MPYFRTYAELGEFLAGKGEERYLVGICQRDQRQDMSRAASLLVTVIEELTKARSALGAYLTLVEDNEDVKTDLRTGLDAYMLGVRLVQRQEGLRDRVNDKIFGILKHMLEDTPYVLGGVAQEGFVNQTTKIIAVRWEAWDALKKQMPYSRFSLSENLQSMPLLRTSSGKYECMINSLPIGAFATFFPANIGRMQRMYKETEGFVNFCKALRAFLEDEELDNEYN